MLHIIENSTSKLILNYIRIFFLIFSIIMFLLNVHFLFVILHCNYTMTAIHYALIFLIISAVYFLFSLKLFSKTSYIFLLSSFFSSSFLHFFISLHFHSTPSFYLHSSWNVRHLYFNTHLHVKYFNANYMLISAYSIVIYAFSSCCCTVNYTLLLFYATSSLWVYTSTPLQIWYCSVNYMLELFAATPSLCLYTSTPVHLYTSTPLHLYTSTPLNCTPLHLYACSPLHLYASLHIYTSMPLHL